MKIPEKLLLLSLATASLTLTAGNSSEQPSPAEISPKISTTSGQSIPFNNLDIKILSGTEARPYFNEIAQFAISMFREFPYLFEGTLEYEKEYLETYFVSEKCTLILVFAGNELVSFTSSIPLNEEMAEIQAPFLKAGIDTSSYLYIGEAMIKKEYQGMKLLRTLLQHHIARAAQWGLKYGAFMTVDRPENHPLKPVDYVSLEPIWEHYGCKHRSDLTVKLAWPQVDSSGKEVDNTLSIWECVIPA